MLQLLVLHHYPVLRSPSCIPLPRFPCWAHGQDLRFATICSMPTSFSTTRLGRIGYAAVQMLCRHAERTNDMSFDAWELWRDFPLVCRSENRVVRIVWVHVQSDVSWKISQINYLTCHGFLRGDVYTYMLGANDIYVYIYMYMNVWRTTRCAMWVCQGRRCYNVAAGLPVALYR